MWYRRLYKLHFLLFHHLVPKKSKADSGTAKRRRASSTSCPYYNQARLEDFKDKLAMEPLDIEQLVDSGKEIKACPYYGTRHSVPFSQVRISICYKSLPISHTETNITVLDISTFCCQTGRPWFKTKENLKSWNSRCSFNSFFALCRLPIKTLHRNTSCEHQ